MSWLCGFLGEPGAESTPFPDALHMCPGDEDLEHVLSGEQLASALDSTFVIVEPCLDQWSLEMLDEVVRRSFGPQEWVYTRGSAIQRSFAPDVYHSAELNETLGRLGLPQVNFWD